MVTSALVYRYSISEFADASPSFEVLCYQCMRHKFFSTETQAHKWGKSSCRTHTRTTTKEIE